MDKSRKKLVKIAALLSAGVMLLTGCATQDKVNPPASEVQQATSTSTDNAVPTEDPTEALTSTPTLEATNTPTPTAAVTATPDPVSLLTDTQRNSINMLNWLTYLSRQINAESNNRLYIEEIYSLVVDETDPEMVDEDTQDRLRGIRQALNRYRMASVKRERIEYLFEQNKASAIRSIIPNPMSIMSAVMAQDKKALAMTVVYMAINSVTSYISATSQNELQYLKDGWELDDAAREVFDAISSDAYDYMVDMVREYQLPGRMSITEKAVNDFVSWKNNDNIVRRIRFLESNKETYQAFGNYWLLLAESYFSNGDYEKCLSAIDAYEALDNKIFRHDAEYAKILPLAIAAAREVMADAEYIKTAKRYTEAIVKNINITDWELRYFAAQTYAELYRLTDNQDYLRLAFHQARDNVNYLIDKQNELNTAYLKKVEDEPVPANEKDKEAQIKKYNDLRKEKRKTELPPIYEPLLANCDLLFILADELQISDAEKQEINAYLHKDGHSVFLVNALAEKYQFPSSDDITVTGNDLVQFTGKELVIPASWLSESFKVTAVIRDVVASTIDSSLISDKVQVSTNDDKNTTVSVSDWTVTKVERKTEGNLSTFVATLSSQAASKISFAEGQLIEIAITPHVDYLPDCYNLTYRVVNAKPNWYDHAAFWNSNVGFERVK